jgi:cell division protease FtsH
MLLRKQLVYPHQKCHVKLPRAAMMPVEMVQPAPFVKQQKDYEVRELRQAPPLVAETGYSWFLNAVKDGKIERVEIAQNGSELRGYANGMEDVVLQVILPPHDSVTIPALLNHNVSVVVKRPQQPEWFDAQNLITLFFELTLMFAILRMVFFGFGGMGGGGGAGGNPFKNMIDSSARLDEEPKTGVTFADVAGCDNAKRDLMETVDFLKNPTKYTAIGAKMPKGVLMVGPPGTGKTRLARAVAGEAGVPFFSASGSEFIEMFVGVGSARIRSLFKRAQEKAPCIIFIDEIDAVGKKRGGGAFGGGGHEEHDQTINQLLTMMDGFTPSTGVVVIGATNRPEILDDALLRPGRFDRQVIVDLPDVVGREAILGIHVKNKPLSADVNLHKIAKVTVGFSGADLENLCNEACIYAARASRTEVTPADFDQALEKLTIGEERRTTLFTDEQRELIAYHEAGHALLGMAFHDFDRIRKISIVPRGSAGGATYFEPKHDTALVTRDYMEKQIMVALGGRIAEELVFGKHAVTNGASGDLMRVTEIAREMITEYGFSTKLAPMNFSSSEGLVAEIEEEVNNLVAELYEYAREIMDHNQATLHALAAELLEKETLYEEDIEKYMPVSESM